MHSITVKARGKINLALDILGRRPDGYHRMEMILQSIELADILTLTEHHKDVRIVCSSRDIPLDGRNIAHRAACLVKNTFHVDKGITIHLQKNIPVAAGLAGGSADGAAVLAGLNRLWGLGLTQKTLMELGLLLGADVPFCLLGGAALARGIGEELTPLDFASVIPVVFIKPSFGMSTAEAYQGFTTTAVKKRPDIGRLITAVLNKDMQGVSAGMANVLESVTISRFPQLQKMKADLLGHGAVASMMSGSGPTIYGLFANEEQAQKACQGLKKFYEGVYLTQTATKGIEFLEGGKVWVQ